MDEYNKKKNRQTLYTNLVNFTAYDNIYQLRSLSQRFAIANKSMGKDMQGSGARKHSIDPAFSDGGLILIYH